MMTTGSPSGRLGGSGGAGSDSREPDVLKRLHRERPWAAARGVQRRGASQVDVRLVRLAPLQVLLSRRVPVVQGIEAIELSTREASTLEGLPLGGGRGTNPDGEPAPSSAHIARNRVGASSATGYNSIKRREMGCTGGRNRPMAVGLSRTTADGLLKLTIAPGRGPPGARCP